MALTRVGSGPQCSPSCKEFTLPDVEKHPYIVLCEDVHHPCEKRENASSSLSCIITRRSVVCPFSGVLPSGSDE